MIGIIVAIVAIGAIIVTCMSAGRIPAMTVTAVAAAAAVLVMPPFLSWEVESGTDLIALLFQSLVGLLLAYRLPPKALQKTRPDACRYSESARYPAEPYSLLSIVRSTMERNADLIRRLDDIEVYGEVERRIAVSLEDLEEVLSDVLRMAFSDSKVRHVSLRIRLSHFDLQIRRALINSGGVQRFRPSSCGVDLRLIFLRNCGRFPIRETGPAIRRD